MVQDYIFYVYILDIYVYMINHFGWMDGWVDCSMVWIDDGWRMDGLVGRKGRREGGSEGGSEGGREEGMGIDGWLSEPCEFNLTITCVLPYFELLNQRYI